MPDGGSRTRGGAATDGAKTALRGRIRESRASLDAAALADAGQRLAEVLLAAPEISAAQRVTAYVSVGREPGTGAIIEALAERGTEVFLPLLLPDGDLDWAPYSGRSRLRSASRGLLEPVTRPAGPDLIDTADAVLVPALAVDRRGTRLGRGGGSYDRALARVSAGTFTCALLHDGELLDIPVPRASHDIPVMAAATPSGLHRFF